MSETRQRLGLRNTWKSEFRLTLLGLLVVMAIVELLTELVGPGLSEIKEKGRQYRWSLSFR